MPRESHVDNGHAPEESSWANERLCVLAKERRLCGTNWDIMCQAKLVPRGVLHAIYMKRPATFFPVSLNTFNVTM